MASKPRRPRSDSAQAAILTHYGIKSTATDLAWPSVVPAATSDVLRETKLFLFEAIVATWAASEWMAMEVVNAARLAGHVAMQVADETTMKRTGSLIKSPNSDKHFIQNPILAALSARQAIINQLSRQLGVSLPAVDLEVLRNSARNGAPQLSGAALTLLAN